MTKQRVVGLAAGLAIFLLAFGAALAVTFIQVSRQVPSNLSFRTVQVLVDDNLGLYHNADATGPASTLSFRGADLRPPLRAAVGPVDLYIRNESQVDLFLIEPCRDVLSNGQRVGFMNPGLFDLQGNFLGDMCDRPGARLAPGEIVRAQVGIQDLTPGLRPGEYPFTAVFGAVGESEPPVGPEPSDGELHGTKFHDLDGDGVRQPWEPGLPDWTIVLEIGTGDRTAHTNSSGDYSFVGVPAGGRFSLREVPQNG